LAVAETLNSVLKKGMRAVIDREPVTEADLRMLSKTREFRASWLSTPS